MQINNEINVKGTSDGTCDHGPALRARARSVLETKIGTSVAAPISTFADKDLFSQCV